MNYNCEANTPNMFLEFRNGGKSRMISVSGLQDIWNKNKYFKVTRRLKKGLQMQYIHLLNTITSSKINEADVNPCYPLCNSLLGSVTGREGFREFVCRHT